MPKFCLYWYQRIMVYSQVTYRHPRTVQRQPFLSARDWLSVSVGGQYATVFETRREDNGQGRLFEEYQLQAREEVLERGAEGSALYKGRSYHALHTIHGRRAMVKGRGIPLPLPLHNPPQDVLRVRTELLQGKAVARPLCRERQTDEGGLTPSAAVFQSRHLMSMKFGRCHQTCCAHCLHRLHDWI